MTQVAADAKPVKSGGMGRNLFAGAVAALGGLMALATAADGPPTASLSILASAVLTLLLTSPGKRWRMRQRIKVPGVVVGGLAGVLFFIGAADAGARSQAEEARRFAELGPIQIAKAREAIRVGDTALAERALSPLEGIDDASLKPLRGALKALKAAGGDVQAAADQLIAHAKDHPKDKDVDLAALAALSPERSEEEGRKAARENEWARLTAKFSKWDGSHPAVVAAVKAGMKNPDSFKHVETTASATGDTIIVTMTYRGTNGFGGVVTERVVAKVDPDGNLHEIARVE